MQRTERYIEIDAPVHRVFDYFSDFENLPRWMDSIRKVQYIGPRRTHWVADAPLGSSVEWDAETTQFEQDRRIAWRSIRGSMATNGAVTFEPTRRNTTLMHVDLAYDPPAGRLGALVARLFGNNPEHQLDEDLKRFKRLVERQLQYQDDDYYQTDHGRRERDRDNRADRLPPVHAVDDRSDRDRIDRDRMEMDRDRGDGGWRDTDRDRHYADTIEHERRSASDRGAWREREHKSRYDNQTYGRDYSPGHSDDYRSADRGPMDRNQNARVTEGERNWDNHSRKRGVERLLDEGPSSRWRR